MKTVIVFVLLFSLIALSLATDPTVEEQFQQWMAKHNKKYDSQQEMKRRMKIFEHNLHYIDQLNHKAKKEGKSTFFVVNKFADISQVEFKNKFLSNDVPPFAVNPLFKNRTKDAVGTPPNVWDWSTQTPVVVTQVRDQQLNVCLSSYAFSAVETVESVWAIAHGQLFILSPQQILDCDNKTNNCVGGNVESALSYVIEEALMPEGNYPYQPAGVKNCRYNPTKVVAWINGWGYSTFSEDDTEIKASVYYDGPNIACVDASIWQFYGGGILAHPCPGTGSHCVQITGYEKTWPGNDPYWVIRNSWGKDWGLDGYAWVERDYVGCGLVEEALYAVSG